LPNRHSPRFLLPPNTPKRNTIAAQGSNNNAIDIEDDDDDNEYTQV
jgi:hypothetical protein